MKNISQWEMEKYFTMGNIFPLFYWGKKAGNLISDFSETSGARTTSVQEEAP
jgi:hypothetical protein